MLWKDKYELGFPLIDNQHKELFRRIDAFLQVVRSADPWQSKVQQVQETLNFMNSYVVEHFRDEEDYQRSIGYPGFEDHRRLHQEMVNYVTQVSKEFASSGYNEQLAQQLAGKLLAWLINHVASEDVHIASYALKDGGENP